MPLDKKQTFEISNDKMVTSVESTSYQVFNLADGITEIWRTREDKYPEQACTDRWISDFGLGDYNWVVRNSLKTDYYKDSQCLPIDILKRIQPANKRDEDKKALFAKTVELTQNPKI